LPSTPKSPVSATPYELPQTTGQAQSKLRIVSSPVTEHSATVDLVPNNISSENMKESESFGRDRPNPERRLIGLTASHVQQAQSNCEKQQVEGLISDNVLTSTSLEQLQQGSQISSTMGGNDARPNLATSNFEGMGDQT